MRCRFSSSRSAKARRTDSTGDPELIVTPPRHAVLQAEPRFSRSIQWNDASIHWMPIHFWGSMAADHLGASLSRLDRFISSASRADDRNKELTVVPSGRGQLARVL